MHARSELINAHHATLTSVQRPTGTCSTMVFGLGRGSSDGGGSGSPQQQGDDATTTTTTAALGLESPHPSEASSIALLSAGARADGGENDELTVVSQHDDDSGNAVAAALSAAVGDDDKGRAAASVEEEVVVDRGGSQGSSKGSGSGKRDMGAGEEGKEEAPTVGGADYHYPDKGPDLAARPKSRSLPTVLRSSYRGGAYVFVSVFFVCFGFCGGGVWVGCCMFKK